MLLIGIGSGLAASYVMEQAQAGLQKLSRKLSDALPAKDGEPSTEKAADALSRLTSGASLPKQSKASAGRVVHYTTGAGLGLVYALLAQRYRSATYGFGLLYGIAVSIILDEFLVPALGLSSPPNEAPISGHVQGFAAHAVYGITLDVVRRTAQRLATAH